MIKNNHYNPTFYIKAFSLFLAVRPIITTFLYRKSNLGKTLFSQDLFNLMVKYDIFFLYLAVAVAGSLIKAGISDRQRIQKVIAIPGIFFLIVWTTMMVATGIALSELLVFFALILELSLYIFTPTASMILAVESFYVNPKNAQKRMIVLTILTLVSYVLAEQTSSTSSFLFQIIHFVPFGYLIFGLSKFKLKH